MEFRTIITYPPFQKKIDYSQNGLSVGSCFAESIARKLTRAKFRILGNPFGVLYNPFSIAETLGILAERRHFGKEDLIMDEDLWHSFYFHGSFSSADREMTLGAMNRAVDQGADALEKSDYVIITFGTAWVYLLDEEGAMNPLPEELDGCIDNGEKIVANCHKFPASMFTRRRLRKKEIVHLYEKLLDGPLRDKHIIMTVSPIRHLKDGLTENTISKSTLILAIHELAERYSNIDYFPSFEIMNDDLRDYRFYREDMVHPMDTAIDYIWEVFGKSAFSPDTARAACEMEKLSAAMEHRPLNPDSESHQRFRGSMAAKVVELQEKYPDIDLGAELNYFME